MNFIIREIKEIEYKLLEDFLYEAIFQRDGEKLLPRKIINNPELRVYIDNFGEYKDDYCLCAEVDNRVVGAIWIRNIKGYGSIDEITPEIAMSLYKKFRGYGIGTEMMKIMLAHLKKKGYQKISLAVQKDNYAAKMYLKLGFEIIDENDEEYLMVHYLQ